MSDAALGRQAAGPGPRAEAARALFDSGAIAEAAAAAEALIRDFPRNPAGYVLRARCVPEADAQAALACWRDVLTRFADRVQPPWRIALARALAASGEVAAAEAELRAVIAAAPEHKGARARLAQLLIDTADRAGIARELASGLFRDGGETAPGDRLKLLSFMGAQQEARDAFHACFAEAQDSATLTTLFMTAPLHFEGFALNEAWRAMRARLEAAPDGDAALLCLKLRLDLGLRDYDRFLARHAEAADLPAPWRFQFGRLAEILQAPCFPDFSRPRVFGIGLTKTATSSLGVALEALGLLQAHFTNPFTNEILQDADMPFFDAVTDTPVSVRFETLAYTYPRAKFVLTVRDVASWQRSFTKHFERSEGPGGYAAFRDSARLRGGMRHGTARALLHAGLYFGFETPLDAWEDFHRRVDAFFSGPRAARLLRHNVFAGDGWDALCAHIGLPVPALPYPWANKAPARGGDSAGAASIA